MKTKNKLFFVSNYKQYFSVKCSDANFVEATSKEEAIEKYRNSSSRKKSVPNLVYEISNKKVKKVFYQGHSYLIPIPKQFEEFVDKLSALSTQYNIFIEIEKDIDYDDNFFITLDGKNTDFLSTFVITKILHTEN